MLELRLILLSVLPQNQSVRGALWVSQQVYASSKIEAEIMFRDSRDVGLYEILLKYIFFS